MHCCLSSSHDTLFIQPIMKNSVCLNGQMKLILMLNNRITTYILVRMDRKETFLLYCPQFFRKYLHVWSRELRWVQVAIQQLIRWYAASFRAHKMYFVSIVIISPTPLRSLCHGPQGNKFSMHRVLYLHLWNGQFNQSSRGISALKRWGKGNNLGPSKKNTAGNKKGHDAP